jgi:uncharacterized protein YbbK (DUF523 family)
MQRIKKSVIAVSRCLLGHAVRYDGESKPNGIVIEQLGELFELLPVCPEVEVGLAVPRPPVRLTGSIDHPRLTGRDDPDLDVSEQMKIYCTTRPAELKHLCGFVFKSRSPSCALNSAPVFIDGDCVTETSRGLFARAMTGLYPDLPVIEETELEINGRYEKFINDVLRYTCSRPG